VRALWGQQPGLFRGFVVDVLTALVFGGLLAQGGFQRTHVVAWAVVNANGGPKVWGLVLVWLGVLLGVTALFGRLVPIALWLLALYYVVIGIAFFVAVWQDPAQTSNYIEVVLVVRCAVMHVSRAQAYREGPALWTE
jgi:hypothetical protein